MAEREKIFLNNKPEIKDGEYVLYWAQAAQRAEFNPALEYSIAQANLTNRPLVVVFCIVEDFPQANLRHFSFMLEGFSLEEFEKAETHDDYWNAAGLKRKFDIESYCKRIQTRTKAKRCPRSMCRRHAVDFTD